MSFIIKLSRIYTSNQNIRVYIHTYLFLACILVAVKGDSFAPQRVLTLQCPQSYLVVTTFGKEGLLPVS